MKNKVIHWIISIITFILCLFICINLFTKYKPYNIINAINSLNKINTANVNFMISKKINSDIGEEKINFIYKFNMNKNFSDENYKNIFATDGNIGIEVESLKLGIYAPIQTILNEKDIDIYFKIDEVYKDLLGLGGDNLIHFNINSLFNNSQTLYNYNDIQKIKETYKQTIIQYCKKHKKDFNFLRNKSQTITSGTIGRITINLNKENLKEFNNLFKENLNDNDLFDSYHLQKIENFINNLILNDKTLNIYLDIYADYISSIVIFNDEYNIQLELKNINNPNTITISKNDKQIEFIDYLQNNLYDILSLFGYSPSNDTNTNLGYFKDKFNTLVSYMTQCIEFSELGNFDYANVMLDNIEKTIEEMKNKELNKDDISLNENDYNKWIELFEELKNYSYLYKNSCENPQNNIEEDLQNSIIHMDKLLKDLGISLNSNFENNNEESS